MEKEIDHALSLLDVLIDNTHCGSVVTSTYRKGPGKRGHIVADTLFPTQMFPHLPPRVTFVADTNFVSGTQTMFLILFRNNFVSATNVSQFAQPKKHHEQQCVHSNVSPSPVPELSFLPAPYRGSTRAGERRVQDNLHWHAQGEPIKSY